MSERPSGNYHQLIAGALFVAFLGFQGWLANTIIDGQSDTSDRLIRLETTLSETRAVRERSDQILDARIERLERDLYERRGRRD